MDQDKPSKLKFLSLEDILTVQDREFVIEEVPEWGGSVKVRGMDTTTRTRYEAKMYKLTKNNKNLEDKEWQLMKIGVLAVCIYGENEQLLFDPSNQAQWELLGRKSPVVIDRLFELCMQLSGLGKAAEGESSAN